MNFFTLISGVLFVFAAHLPLQAQLSIGLGAGGGITAPYLFRANVSLEWTFRPVWTLRSEIGIAQQNNPAFIQALSVSGVAFASARESYLEIPFLLKGQLKLKQWEWYGLVGPQLNWLLNLQAWREEEDGRLTFVNLDPEENFISRIDVGLLTGLGVQKQISEVLVLFGELRYFLGLRNIEQRGQLSLYNQGHFFQIGFRFYPSKAFRKKNSASGLKMNPLHWGFL